ATQTLDEALKDAPGKVDFRSDAARRRHAWRPLPRWLAHAVVARPEEFAAGLEYLVAVPPSRQSAAVRALCRQDQAGRRIRLRSALAGVAAPADSVVPAQGRVPAWRCPLLVCPICARPVC